MTLGLGVSGLENGIGKKHLLGLDAITTFLTLSSGIVAQNGKSPFNLGGVDTRCSESAGDDVAPKEGWAPISV